MKEVWRAIEGYEFIYQVSNLGNVRRVSDKRPLRPIETHYGYKRVALSKNGKRRMFAVHRLVAKEFVKNPKNLPEVNHKNENASDNRAENLEWCDHRYNVNYGTRMSRIRREVQMLGDDGEVLRTFRSQKEAAEEMGTSQGAISNACKGRQERAGGHRWRFAQTEGL